MRSLHQTDPLLNACVESVRLNVARPGAGLPAGVQAARSDEDRMIGMLPAADAHRAPLFLVVLTTGADELRHTIRITCAGAAITRRGGRGLNG